MASRFWGSVVNGLLPGTPYNRHTQTYNPAALRTSIVSGVVGQANPLAGKLTEMVMSRNPQVQAHYAGMRGWDGMLGEFKGNQYQPTLDMGNLAPQGWNMGQVNPAQSSGGLANMLAQNEATIGKQLSDRLNAIQAVPGASPRSSMAAGGHTIAEGAAAQQMFGDMRDAAQQGQMAYHQQQWKQRYGGHEG